jgi:hypothetical protein
MELRAFMYTYQLSAPTNAMQVTLVCINDKKFHDFLQTTDLSSINTTNEDGENPPLIFETLAV